MADLSAKKPADLEDLPTPGKMSATGSPDRRASVRPVTVEVEGLKTIRRVGPDERLRALSCLWGANPGQGRAHARRFIAYAAETGLDLDQCWSCERKDGELGPTCLAVPNAGRSALLFVSNLTDRSRFGELAALLRTVAEQADPDRILVLQALLARPERRARSVFETAGYEHLAELSYMERRIRESDRERVRKAGVKEPIRSNVVFERYTTTIEQAFLDALEASYEQTLDCPRLCGLRPMADVLRGHQATGEFDPDLWTLARVEGKPAALLLLSQFPEQEVVELTYLGVGHESRGLGLGRQLLDRAIDQAARVGASKITLAVDDGNDPAMRLYRSAGFHRIDRRTAMIHAGSPRQPDT